ncbi:MAG TPA: ABC transporter substrate-binding protein [Candidatus Limnocylindrales bacterium]
MQATAYATSAPAATNNPATNVPTSQPTATSGPATFGGTITMLTHATDFDYYDPQRVYTGEDLWFFGATVMRALVAYKYSPDAAENTTIEPDMATDTGTPNADATSWTFTLRDGLTWQDGSPLKCADIKYGVSRTFATDVIIGGPTYAIAYLNIPKNDDGSSQYPGPYTATPDQQALFDAAVSCDGNVITFNLAQTVADFNYTTTLGFGAVPNPIDHPGVDTGENYVGDAVWSDGPYKITTYSPSEGGSLVMERNEQWNRASDNHRGAYPDKWVVKFGLDLKVIDQRLMESNGADASAIDYFNIEPENLTTVFADAHTPNAQFEGRAFSDFDPYTLYYWINTRTITNRDIRAAMAAALDRGAIRLNAGGEFVGDFADGAIKPNTGQDYAPTSFWDSLLGKAIPVNGDPDYAKTLIANSGEPAPTIRWNYPITPTGDRNAAIVQQSLEKAGFKVKIEGIDPTHYYSTIFDNELKGDAGSSGWGPDWPNASTVIPPLFTDAGGFNLSNVSDDSGIPDWLEQVADAQTTIDRAAQAAKWQDLNKKSVEQVWIIPTFFNLAQNMGGTNVGNLYRSNGSWPYGVLYLKDPNA